MGVRTWGEDGRIYDEHGNVIRGNMKDYREREAAQLTTGGGEHVEPHKPWPRPNTAQRHIVQCTHCHLQYNFADGHLCANPPPQPTSKQRLDMLRATAGSDHRSLRLFVLDVAEVLLEAIEKR